MVFKTKGICAREISYEVSDGKVYNVKFMGGCDGNLKGVARLVEGREISEVITLLEGITCGRKDTSCPDQLTIALKQHLA